MVEVGLSSSVFSSSPSLTWLPLLLLLRRHSKATCALFEELKQGEEEPVPDEKEFDAATDTDPVEFLRRLPGVTPFNIFKVIEEVDNLHELSRMSKAKLMNLLGAKNGAKLHKFFNTSYENVQ